MVDRYWAKLRCNGTGNVPGIFVQAGEVASFTVEFSHPNGGWGSIDCEICFEKYGVIGDEETCVNAGSLAFDPRCECGDLVAPLLEVGLQDDPVCPENQVLAGPYQMGGSAGDCYACFECEYGNDWYPPAADICAGITATQTVQSTIEGCPDKTRSIVGEMQPNWSAWEPAASTQCSGVFFQQARYDRNGCVADQYAPAVGTKDCSSPGGAPIGPV